MKKELTPEQKEARRIYQKEYYLINKAKKEKYYKDNKNSILSQKKVYREENKEKINKQRKQYRELNKEKLKLLNKKWCDNNKEYLKKYNKGYREQNKEKINGWVKEYRKYSKKFIDNRRLYENNKYKTDNFYKIKKVYSSLVRSSFKRKNIHKSLKSVKILGCTISEFKTHLEAKFEPWMNWDNYGLYNGELNHGWDIDHIIPVASSTIEEELLKLNHFRNLQPLCSKVNRDIKRHNLI
jgi:hypothetical protein